MGGIYQAVDIDRRWNRTTFTGTVRCWGWIRVGTTVACAGMTRKPRGICSPWMKKARPTYAGPNRRAGGPNRCRGPDKGTGGGVGTKPATLTGWGPSEAPGTHAGGGGDAAPAPLPTVKGFPDLSPSPSTGTLDLNLSLDQVQASIRSGCTLRPDVRIPGPIAVPQPPSGGAIHQVAHALVGTLTTEFPGTVTLQFRQHANDDLGPGGNALVPMLWSRCSHQEYEAQSVPAPWHRASTVLNPLAGCYLKQDLPGIPLEPDLGVGVM